MGDNNVSDVQTTPIVVLDCGSGVTKAGFAGEDRPRNTFPSLFARTQATEDDETGTPTPTYYVGADAISHIKPKSTPSPIDSGLICSYPIERSAITNWEDIEYFWDYTYTNILQINSDDYPLILSEPPLNPTLNRERTTEIFFETFNVPSLYLLNQSNAGLYSVARTSGVLVDCGAATTTTLPILDSFPYLHTLQRVDFGGLDLTKQLTNLLESNFNLIDAFNPLNSGVTSPELAHAATVQFYEIERLKTELCYVALDYRLEQHACSKAKENYTKSYKLPDGTEISVASERFMIPELLFKPKSPANSDSMSLITPISTSLVGISKSIPESICESIATTEEDIEARKVLFGNVILTGGSMCFRNITERVTKDVSNNLAQDLHDSVNIVDLGDEEKKNAVWLGEALFAQLPTSVDQFIKKSDYDEFGPGVVNKKISIYS